MPGLELERLLEALGVGEHVHVGKDVGRVRVLGPAGDLAEPLDGRILVPRLVPRGAVEPVVRDRELGEPGVERIAGGAGTLSARDPLARGPAKSAVAYYRLPGPAGHKSRYEDPAIERLADIARAARHKDATYVFTNVDMFADAKRFKKAIKL